MKAYAAMGLLHADDIELIDIDKTQTAPGHGGCDRRGHRSGCHVRTSRAREGRGGQRRRGIAAEPGHLTGYVGAP